MMDFVAGCFALIFFIAFVGGIVGMIVPRAFRFGKPERPSRRRIAGIAFATFVAAFIGFVVTVPEPSPEQKAKLEKERVEAAAKAKIDEEAQAEEAAKTKAAEETKARVKAEATHKEIVQLWAKIIDLGRVCDGTRARVVAALESGDRYDAFEWASSGSVACRMAHSAVRVLDAPAGLSGEHKDGIEKAIGTCADAYLSKKMGFDDLKLVIDGDARPSVVTAAKERAEASVLLTMHCAAQYLAVGGAAGVPLELISAAGVKSAKE